MQNYLLPVHASQNVLNASACETYVHARANVYSNQCVCHLAALLAERLFYHMTF